MNNTDSTEYIDVRSASFAICQSLLDRYGGDVVSPTSFEYPRRIVWNYSIITTIEDLDELGAFPSICAYSMARRGINCKVLIDVITDITPKGLRSKKAAPPLRHVLTITYKHSDSTLIEQLGTIYAGIDDTALIMPEVVI